MRHVSSCIWPQAKYLKSRMMLCSLCFTLGLADFMALALCIPRPTTSSSFGPIDTDSADAYFPVATALESQVSLL